MSLRQKAIRKIADLELNGIDYQAAVQEVLYDSDEFSKLFAGMDDDEKQEEANGISSAAESYNEKRAKF